MLRTRALFNNLIDISLRWNTTFLCDSSGQSAIKLSKCDLHYCYSSALYGWIAETTQEQNQKLDSPCDEAAATWMPRWCNIPSQPRILSANSNTEDITGLQYAYWIAFTVKFTIVFLVSLYRRWITCDRRSLTHDSKGYSSAFNWSKFQNYCICQQSWAIREPHPQRDTKGHIWNSTWLVSSSNWPAPAINNERTICKASILCFQSPLPPVVLKVACTLLSSSSNPRPENIVT